MTLIWYVSLGFLTLGGLAVAFIMGLEHGYTIGHRHGTQDARGRH